MNNYRKHGAALIFYGGLISHLYRAEADTLLAGASLAIFISIFIEAVAAKNDYDAYYAAECLFLALVAFILA